MDAVYGHLQEYFALVGPRNTAFKTSTSDMQKRMCAVYSQGTGGRSENHQRLGGTFMHTLDTAGDWTNSLDTVFDALRHAADEWHTVESGR